MRKRFSVLLTLALLAAACSEDTAVKTTVDEPPGSVPEVATTTSAVGPKLVIVDYSPTVSDVAGFLYLLAHPDVEVIAVSLPVTGEAGCELGLQVTLGVLAMMEKNDVPVACDPFFGSTGDHLGRCSDDQCG